MIICHCNNITSKDIAKAKESGCNNVKDVCNYLEMDIQCATCLKQIREELDND